MLEDTMCINQQNPAHGELYLENNPVSSTISKGKKERQVPID